MKYSWSPSCLAFVGCLVLHFRGGIGLLDAVAELGAQFGQVAADRQRAAMLVDQAEVHEQVRPQLARAEGVERQLHCQVFLGGAGQRPHQGFVEVMLRIAKASGELVQRLQAVAVLLLQGLQQRQQLFLEQAGHQPFAAVGRQLVERRQPQRQGHAVVGRAGIVVISELE